jgi:GTPase
VIEPVFAGGGLRGTEARLAEACSLAQALDLCVVERQIVPMRRISPSAYLGTGRVEMLRELVQAHDARVVVIDAALSPVQQRNLETALVAKVVDRTGLILEIFGRRAQTREGILQVELARLDYERSRLVRTWTHLERQRGGLGKTGGPGETQLELDRRQIGARIDRLKAEIEEVRRTRGLQRRARARASLPAVVLVGYTNAGKSSLFNALTQAGVLAKDMVFATLDPVVRAVRLPQGGAFALSDTVGFISDLPTDLVAAFRATLEAAAEADLLIHVRDGAHEDSAAQKADVEAVLEQVFTQAQRRPVMIEVLNKIDLLSPEIREARLRRADPAYSVAVSAQTGEGLDRLLEAIDLAVFGVRQAIRVEIEASDGRTHAWIHAHGRVLSEIMQDNGRALVTALLPEQHAAQLDAHLAKLRHSPSLWD